VAEYAVRSEKVSRGSSLHSAICREIFRNCRESRFFAVEFTNYFNNFKELSLFTEQGAFLVSAGKSSVELRM
jgi:hypothetical protein